MSPAPSPTRFTKSPAAALGNDGTIEHSGIHTATLTFTVRSIESGCAAARTDMALRPAINLLPDAGAIRILEVTARPTRSIGELPNAVGD